MVFVFYAAACLRKPCSDHHIAALIRRAPEFGLQTSNLKASLNAIIDRKNRLIKEFTDYRIEALQHPRFTLYQEKAHFLSPTLIQAGPHLLSAKAFIIATGSVVSHIPIPGLEEAGYLTSDDALELRTRPLSTRYIGSFVADFHRNLLKGGLYIYPATQKSPNGKLRLMYEANPMAFIVEQAGGSSSDGRNRILDIKPEKLHQRIPLYIGSKRMVETAEGFLRGERT